VRKPNHGMVDADGATRAGEARAKAYSALVHGDFFTVDATDQVPHNRRRRSLSNRWPFGTLQIPDRYPTGVDRRPAGTVARRGDAAVPMRRW
jgi:hypothetical protein